jgi:hypothetical protein
VACRTTRITPAGASCPPDELPHADFAPPFNPHYLGPVLDASKDRLENAPGFDNNDWSDIADTAWEKGVHDFYGTRPYVDPRAI